MKYFSLVLVWFTTVALALCCSTASLIQADPTDDFSFSLGHTQEADLYSLVSERKVADILRDRLDLFPEALTPRLARQLVSLCRRYRFDPAFILALIQVESGFHIKAVSSVGAIGLMQVMPATAAKVAEDLNLSIKGLSGRRFERALTDPLMNLTIGIAYLAWLREHYYGFSPYYLVAAYNIGPARLDDLLTRKSFHPTQTKRYFDAIRRGVPEFRFYHSNTANSAAPT